MEAMLRDTVLEINLDNIKYNMEKIKEMLGEEVAIAAVVKANGYGHGSLGIAKELVDSGADYLAVATLNEALELRRFKDYKIFIMGFTPDDYLEYIVENDIVQSIFSYEQAKILNDLGIKHKKKVTIHIKYDTGFNRLGFKDSDKSIDEIESICQLSNLNVEGIFSHLALKSRRDDEKQYDKLVKAINKLKSKGIDFKYKHIEDSISAVDYPEFRLNMIRPGAIIYGIKGFHYGSLDIKQALTFKTKVRNVRKISKGEGVSYDYLWKSQDDSIIGTLPFGYADGYPRNLRDKGFVTIRGRKAPIIGVICMDQCMVDLTNIPEACDGDEVIIYGDGNDNTLDIHNASLLAETNKNDIISRISMRVPRVYRKAGKIINIINYI